MRVVAEIRCAQTSAGKRLSYLHYTAPLLLTHYTGFGAAPRFLVRVPVDAIRQETHIRKAHHAPEKTQIGRLSLLGDATGYNIIGGDPEGRRSGIGPWVQSSDDRYDSLALHVVQQPVHRFVEGAQRGPVGCRHLHVVGAKVNQRGSGSDSGYFLSATQGVIGETGWSCG